VARPRNETQAKIREELGVKERQARRLEKQGVDGEKLSELTREKIRKLKIEIATQEAKLAKFNRDVIPRTEALQYGIRLADIANELSSECITNWPTELAGKKEIQVREIVSRRFGEFNERFIAEAKAL
jgi:hypothetical protein